MLPIKNDRTREWSYRQHLFRCWISTVLYAYTIYHRQARCRRTIYSLRAEAEGYGIKVSVVCPGNVKTNIFNTIKVVGASSAIVQKRIAKSHLMSADTAAKHILRGVARNKAIIPLTASAHIVWRLYRYTREFTAYSLQRSQKITASLLKKTRKLTNKGSLPALLDWNHT